MKIPLLATLLIATTFAGCLDLFGGGDHPFDRPLNTLDFEVPNRDGNLIMPAEDIEWPDFTGATLRILDHGAFGACADAGERFQELTGAKVECTSEADTGSALNRAIRDSGSPEFDILYGVDNMLLKKAEDAKIFSYYTPQMAHRIPVEYRFFEDEDTDRWPATPVDFGYIALNIDAQDVLFNVHAETGCDGVQEIRAEGKENAVAGSQTTEIEDYGDVRAAACLFVTQDPRLSTPGLGFMLTTIATYGDDTANDPYDWLDYWRDLFVEGVRVTSDWSTAYETYFSGGYGIYEDGHIGDRPIVTSYSESPAYEWYWDELCPSETPVKCPYPAGGHYNSSADNLPEVLLSGPSAFHQIQLMGILRGTNQLAIAQAWIEFTLTDDYQEMIAEQLAVYPVTVTVSADDVFDNKDPFPGTFETAEMDYEYIGANLEGWLDAWTTLCEEYNCA